MESRKYFTFYRSFYEAIKDLPNDIKLEVLTAIAEYGLYGVPPKGLKPFTKSIFALIKPNMDANLTRFESGKKGGRPKGTKNKKTESVYSLAFEEEVKRMSADNEWVKAICHDFSVAADDVRHWLANDFINSCKCANRGGRRHDSLEDAKSHFRNWMDKRRTPAPAPTPAPQDEPPFPESDYSYNGGFGSIDE